MPSEKIVIIGGVATGPKVAARLRRLDPNADITVIEKNQYISYGGCGLPLLVGGVVGSLDDLMSTASGAIRNVEFFLKEKNVRVLTGMIAKSIDRESKKVFISSVDESNDSALMELPYDKLVLATGAEPFIPPVPGADLPGVVTLHKPQDAIKLKEGLGAGAKNIVIVGGGLIGLETAEGLAGPKKSVTIIEREKRLASNMLDEEMAILVKDRLELNLVDVLLNESIVEIREVVEGDKTYKIVKTTNKELKADLVIMACGVRPNSKLAKECGLTVGITGGIIVDRKLRTSDPNIYAGGDCVENTCRITNRPTFLPLASIANKQGRVIANNIYGLEDEYPGVIGTSAFQVFEFNVGKTGLTEGQALAAGYQAVVSLTSGLDATHYHPNHSAGTIKLIADQKTGKILGAQAVGTGDVIKRIDVVSAVIAMNGTVDDLRNLDLCYAPVYATAIDLVIHAANTMDNILKGNAQRLLPGLLAGSNDSLILDVRSKEESAGSPFKVEQAINIPLNQLRERLAEVPVEKNIITICPLGIRAYEASRILQNAGYKNAHFLAGGLRALPEDDKL